MKKIVVSGIVIGAFMLYAIIYHKSHDDVVTIPVGTGKTNISQPTGTTQSNPTSTNTTASTASTASSQQTTGAYKDGSYTGTAADASYGMIQVKAIISGGKLTDVQFLQYPNDRNQSIMINNAAMPLLKQEAIQAQSATVDIVSHATDSSMAFQQSLASALSQAH
jgi:uncharacterized protein with FMN-binding domain